MLFLRNKALKIFFGPKIPSEMNPVKVRVRVCVCVCVCVWVGGGQRQKGISKWT